MLRRTILGVFVIGALLAATVTPTSARGAGVERAPVVVEFNEDGSPGDGSTVGWTALLRRTRWVGGVTHVSGLEPGGVYTFWKVAIDPAFNPDAPDFSLIYVDRGNARVVGRSGRATVFWSARAGDASIDTSSTALPTFGTLTDIGERIIRVEIAYHGQKDGPVPPSWLENFWDGDPAWCQTDPGVPPGMIIGHQPHCPVFQASTHPPT